MKTKRTLQFAALLAVAMAFGGVFLFLQQVDAHNHLIPEAGKAQSLELRMEPGNAEVHSGTPTFRVAEFGKSLDGKATSGIWECVGPTKFTWSFGLDEAIYVLEGGATVEYLGKTFEITAGTETHFFAGTKAVWTVPERIKKSWALYHPPLLSRVFRKLSDFIPANADLSANAFALELK